MSATERFQEIANDALGQIADRLWPGAKLCLVIYTPGEPGRDIVFKDQGLDLNEVVNSLRRSGLSIDTQNAYRSDLLDSVVGALAFGKQNRNPPPEGHWGRRFWDIGHAEGELQRKLLVDLIDAAAQLRAYEILHRAKGTAESTAKAEVNATLAARFEATIAKATA